MAGIYIHVPFCKTRCIYCDFYTRTNMEQKMPYVSAICKELALRSDYVGEEPISTIYFGGGTPSQLSETDFKSIFKNIYEIFAVENDAEITLEANPDDLNSKYLDMLRQIGFNRLSMGVQSFDDEQLQFLNRRHSAQKAIDIVRASQQSGFSNISIDLMYGLPGLTLDLWNKTLDTAIDLNIQHISSYHLIYEQGTKLYRLLQKGDIKSVDEELSVQMFTTLIKRLQEINFIHYEISNFGKEGYFSRHNSSYWLGAKYLGLGPSAHSYNGLNRCWNISSISKYIQGISENNPNLEIEDLDVRTQYNDFILTGMRTMWGINRNDLQKEFGLKYTNYCDVNIARHLKSGDVLLDGHNYKISSKGIFVSDSIMSDLMYID